MSEEDTVVATESVIAAVYARPMLWDASNEAYKSRDIRQTAWRELCRELVDGFDDYDSAEQKAIDAKIQQRWKTARDCYVKTKTSHNLRPDGSKRKKAYDYVHSHLLTFLDRTMRLPAPEQPPPSSEHPPSRHQIKFNTFRGLKQPLKILKKNDSKVKLQERKTEAFLNASKKGDNMSEFEKQLLECLRKDSSPLEPDDSHFFKSLAPILKEFNSNTKLLFRSKVIEIAMAMQTSQSFDGEPIPGDMDPAGAYLYEGSDHSLQEVEEKYSPF